MGTEQQRGSSGTSDASVVTGLVQPLRAALAAARESERYRVLAALLTELADASGERDTRAAGSELENLTRRIQTLTEQKALLEDEIAALKADVTRQRAQLEAEQARGRELDAINREQRGRLESLQKAQRDLEAQLVDRNAEVHKAQVENERLLVSLQRAELGREDSAATDRLEGAKRQLAKDLEAAKAEIVQLRADKDGEIARLHEELAKNRAAQSGGQQIPLTMIWERLASVSPPLVDRGTEPTQQWGERLADGFIELVRFVDDFDQLIRPFLTKYTKHNPQIKVPWEVYASRDNTRKTVEQALLVKGGKPIGVVKIRLRGLYAWTEAAMIGCDAAIESVASELQTFLLGLNGVGTDPNRTIREFLRGDGHELFLQHIRGLRGLKMAEAFGRGG